MPDTPPTRIVDLLVASTALTGKSNDTDPAPADATDLDDLFLEAVTAFEEALESGQILGRNVWLAKFPQVADRLAKYFSMRPLHVLEQRPEIPDYEIVEEIGHGGSGTVYKARQHSLDRIVALKTIRTGPHATASQIERFGEE